MKLFTRGGELPFTSFAFPDGQPHFELLHRDEFQNVTIETAITSAYDLLLLLLAKDALSAAGYLVSVDIRYLLGARMDRRIDTRQPATLEVIGRMVLAAGFTKVRVLDPHSDRGLAACGAVAVLPTYVLSTVLAMQSPDSVIVAPDAGATPRIERCLSILGLRDRFRIAQCHKVRDSAGGRLSQFSIDDASFLAGKPCLILDDLCDGGATFVGLARELHVANVASVDLYVTHGVFSKGPALQGIRRIYTTDSYQSIAAADLTCFPVEMRGMADVDGATPCR